MPTPEGWPEGQAPSTVNNCARQMMATIRTQWNDAAWFNWGFTVSRVSGNSFLVTSATNSTVTLPAAFVANARLKLYDSTTLYGTITTVSASAASTLVTFDPDAFSLTASFSSVANSIIPPDNTPIPGLSIPTDVVTQTTQQIYGVDNGATNSAHINLTPVLSSYVSGQLINVKALQTNTGPMTLQIGALGNKNVKKNVSEDLEAGDYQSGQIVPLVYDGTNFQVVGGGGGTATGNAVTQEVTQNSHGFVVGDVLYLNGSTYTKAIATSAAAAEAVGMVSEVVSTNSFVMTTSGYVTGLSGLSAGNVYFVSPSSAGAITATEPSTVGQISKPVFVTDSTTTGYFVNYRGYIVPSATSGGLVVQRVSTQTGAVASGSTAFPIDDTIPQITEGDQYMSLAITPQDANNILVITVTIMGSESTAASYAGFYAALFQDATANALAAMGASNYVSANNPTEVVFTHIMTAGTTSATTFRVRAGVPTGTFVFNGVSGPTRQMGGVMASSIQITEYTS